MPQQNQHIHCTIDNCHYWQTGNKCAANEILVASDSFGQSQPDQVDATMAQQLSTEQADSCMSTCCKTFVPKGADETSVDGVKKM